MNKEYLEIPGSILIKPDVYKDDRGYFLESFQKKKYQHAAIRKDFIQDNLSFSYKNIVRGLHYQINNPVGHMVYVNVGSILDVGVDLREDSNTFGQYISCLLDANTFHQVYWPPGVAHGFLTLDDINQVCYKCTGYYDPDDEGGLRWNDVEVGIKWPLSHEKISIKSRDAKFMTLADIKKFGKLPKINVAESIGE